MQKRPSSHYLRALFGECFCETDISLGSGYGLNHENEIRATIRCLAKLEAEHILQTRLNSTLSFNIHVFYKEETSTWPPCIWYQVCEYGQESIL